MTRSAAEGQRAPGWFLGRRDRPLILYVIQLPDYGGGELMHLPVLRADADPLLACPPYSRTEELARRLGIPTVPLPFRPLRRSQGALDTIRSVFRGLASARDLRRVLRRHPERRIVYATQARPGMLAAVAGIGLGRKRMWTLCEFLPPPPLRAAVRLLGALGCDVAMAQSHAIERDFVRRSRRLAARTTVVNLPGTDPQRRVAASAEPGSPTAAIVGSISTLKRTDLAVEIARRVGREVPDFHLLVIGRPQFRESDFRFDRELRERVEADPELRGRVTFVGWVEDVRQVLAGCGLLLHCCTREGFGLALLEAMEQAVPVVAPDAGGPAEIVEDGVTGLLYAPADADDATRQVLRLLGDPALARCMSDASLEAVRGRLHSDRQLAAAERLIASVA